MIHIRRAKTSDLPQLEHLFMITRKHTFFWESPDKFLLSDYKKLTRGETVFVAENLSRKIVGLISVWEKEQPPFIHNLFVLPDHQGKGIGKLLIDSLIDYQIFPPYHLKCVVKNEKALNFYKKNGWTEQERGIGEEGEYILLESSILINN